MRQGQQNRRGRGRHNGGSNNNNNNNNHNNRKHQNPLTRSFDSNGPDQKIRGTPAHIADKYVSLARDALSAGDPVLAENYLQHAEHYNRIIMTYREQQEQQQQNHHQQRQQRHQDDRDQPNANDDDDAQGEQQRTNGHAGANGAHNGHASGSQNGSGSNGAHRQPRRAANDDEQPTVHAAPSAAEDEPEAEQAPAPAPRARTPRPRRQPRERAPRRAETSGGEGSEGSDQPDFLTRPIQRTSRKRSEATPEDAPASKTASVPEDSDA
ncbi:MAG: DUF4167 domain-containing protein [Pseudomonadota bacterium]